MLCYRYLPLRTVEIFTGDRWVGRLHVLCYRHLTSRIDKRGAHRCRFLPSSAQNFLSQQILMCVGVVGASVIRQRPAAVVHDRRTLQVRPKLERQEQHRRDCFPPSPPAGVVSDTDAELMVSPLSIAPFTPFNVRETCVSTSTVASP